MLDISRLDHRDLDAALHLSTQADWNQTIVDLERFLALTQRGFRWLCRGLSRRNDLCNSV